MCRSVTDRTSFARFFRDRPAAAAAAAASPPRTLYRHALPAHASAVDGALLGQVVYFHAAGAGPSTAWRSSHLSLLVAGESSADWQSAAGSPSDAGECRLVIVDRMPAGLSLLPAFFRAGEESDPLRRTTRMLIGRTDAMTPHRARVRLGADEPVDRNQNAPGAFSARRPAPADIRR